MHVRPAEEDDLLACARIFARTAGYLDERYHPDADPGARDPDERLPMYHHLLRTGAVFLAEDPEPVGFSAAIVRDRVWFLSQLWVLPERHGGGLGARLLDEALAWGRGARAFSVIASQHPAAQLLYLRASMYPLWVQHEFGGAVPPPGEPPRGIEPLGAADQPWVDALDREVRGTARPEDHAFFRAQDVHALMLARDGEPRGYVYAWRNGKIGPGAVRDPVDMAQLLRAGRHRIGGKALALSVPSTNWSALREVTRLGLKPLGASTFMASRPLGEASRYLSGGGALG